MYQLHPDPDVQHAITRLCDALCQWERTTSRESLVTIREHGYTFRAVSGKPLDESELDLSDDQIRNALDV